MDSITFTDPVACEARADRLEAMSRAVDDTNDRYRLVSQETRKALLALLVGKCFLQTTPCEKTVCRFYADPNGVTRCTATSLSESDILWSETTLRVSDSERVPFDNVRALFPSVPERLLTAVGWIDDVFGDGTVPPDVREITEVEYHRLRTEMVARAREVVFPPTTTQTHVLTGRVSPLSESGV